MVKQNTISKIQKQDSIFNKFKMIVASSKTQLLLWVCRVLSFFWIYLYHDYQSVVILVWLCHSTLFRSSRNFKRFMLFFYLPLFTLIFFWYYVINIYGFLKWPPKEDPMRIKHYRYGLFQFTIPPLESAFMFLNLYSFVMLTFSLDLTQ